MPKTRKRLPVTAMHPDSKLKATVLLCFAAGFLLGIPLAGRGTSFQHEDLLIHIESYLYQFSGTDFSRSIVLQESLFKYGLFMALIWLLGFFTAGAAGALGLLLVKGIGYGFTTTLLTASHGIKGLFYALALTLPQGLIIVPAYFFICYSCLRFIFVQGGTLEESAWSKASFGLTEYILVLMLCLGIACLASFYEAFALPWIFENLII